MVELRGKTIIYFPNGKKDREIDYIDDKKHGKYISYYATDNVYRVDEYNNDIRSSRTHYHLNGKIEYVKIYRYYHLYSFTSYNLNGEISFHKVYQQIIKYKS